jgi:alkylated DNA repair dioxygenase AlkB
MQASLFADPAMPEGFRYQAEFITRAEESALLAQVEALAFKPFEFQGYVGLRKVAYFGWSYDFSRGRVGEAPPIPEFLIPLRDKVGTFAGRPGAAFEQVLINAYEPGAPIGWHRDRPQFGEVAGVSLGAPTRFRMRRKQGSGWERASMTVEPRSIYLLTGPAREVWEHSLPPAEKLRYSITFRTLRA